jgi:hypothetical protein
MNDHKPSPRGILALITGPLKSANDDSYKLQYIQRNRQSKRLKRTNRTKRRSHNDNNHDYNHDLEKNITNDTNTNTTTAATSYHPTNAEFSLLFFCDLYCSNSSRFTFILSNFLKDVQTKWSSSASSNNHDMNSNDSNNDYNNPDMIPSYQLICIPNDNIQSYSEVENGTIMSHLKSETDYWHLGFNHKNRLAIIRMLSVSQVPTLVVIENKTGKVITYNGIEAIEWSEEGQSSAVFEKWRSGNSAVPFLAILSQSCCIS